MATFNRLRPRARVLSLALAALSSLSIVALAVVAAAQAPAAAVQSKQSLEFEISGVFVSNCPGGEDVNMTGDGSVRVHIVETPAGGMTFQQQIKGHAVGEGVVTGAKYQLNATDTAVVQLPAGGNGVSLMVSNQRVVGPGPDNNLVLSTRYHITVDASGVPAVQRNETTIECR